MVDWDELVHLQGPAVWRTIYRLVQHQADADECLQETLPEALILSSGGFLSAPTGRPIPRQGGLLDG